MVDYVRKAPPPDYAYLNTVATHREWARGWVFVSALKPILIFGISLYVWGGEFWHGVGLAAAGMFLVEFILSCLTLRSWLNWGSSRS